MWAISDGTFHVFYNKISENSSGNILRWFGKFLRTVLCEVYRL
jgi:hypothetical protein